MLTGDDEITIQYSATGDANTPPDRETPAARRATMERTPLRNVEFGSEDDETQVRQSYRERTDRPVRTTDLLETVDGLLRRRSAPMKPGRFDGTGSWESFYAQFEVCARHNRWTPADKVDHLRCALEKAATQLLWDFSAQADVSYEDLVERLRQRYGSEGQAETFRAQLYYRRQRAEESLSDLLHEIRRLVVLAYPVPSNETTQIIAKDSFLEALRDRELSLKVREREPQTLDEAYRTALRLEAYQRASESDDRRRPTNRVRGTQEIEPSAQLQATLDRFLTAQRDDQRQWQREIEDRIDRQLRELRSQAPNDNDRGRNDRPGNRNDGDRQQETTRRAVTCFNCDRTGHVARDCRQARRFRNRGNDAGTTGTEEPMQPEPVAMNHTTRSTLPDRASNNAIYIRGTINGQQQLCLIDTGSEVSLVPSSVIEGLELRSCNRTLMAANGSEIRVLGEVLVSIKIGRGFEIPTTFLVSDQIVETMLGMDWLREHRCRLGFGAGALFVGKRRISLLRGNGSNWCRRVIVAEEVVVLPKCQREVPVEESPPLEALIAELPEEVPPENRGRQRNLLAEHSDVFSVTDRNVRRMSMCKRKNETGEKLIGESPRRRTSLQQRNSVHKDFACVVVLGALLMAFLSVNCSSAKCVEAAPMANRGATLVARIPVENVIVGHGVPPQIWTDQGRVMNSHRSDWDEVLPCAPAAYRASRYDVTESPPNGRLAAQHAIARRAAALLNSDSLEKS